jgi:lipopolysaccharide transport system ATP-binding protein
MFGVAMKPIIKVESLGKRYRMGARRNAYATLRERIMSAARAPFKASSGRARRETFWALRDISFEVRPGEIVGIIGRNGAGKSTLLKILSRITAPTEGRVEMHGRVSSLLEVGTGFHPELTGRENVYLNGAILGMRSAEIKRRFDEIVRFAEVERFINTPVKHYSSGMYTRLAFAVAAHLEPEILLIDEALAVGDAEFQKKCLGKMSEAARAGRTVLFVSHNMAAVEKLCQRGVLLEQGQIKYTGSQTEAIARYLTGLQANAADLRDRTDRTGTGLMRIVAIEVRDSQDRPLEIVASGQDVDIYLHYEASPGFQDANVVAGLGVSTQLGVPVFLQHNRLTQDSWGASLPQRGAFVCRLRRLPLPPSTYRLTYSLLQRDGQYLDMLEDAGALTVTAGDFFGSGEVPPLTHGCCLVDAEWRLETAAEPRRETETRRETVESCP